MSSSRFLARKANWIVYSAVALLLGVASCLAAKNQADASKTVSAKTASHAYLQLDINNKALTVRMGQTILREYPILEADNGDWDTQESAADSQTIRVTSVVLLSARPVLSDMELRVIGEEFNLTPEAIQRYVPETMVLTISNDTRIVIHAECEGASQFRLEQAREFFSRLWYGLWGETILYVKLSSDDAMSLLGVARNNPIFILK